MPATETLSLLIIGLPILMFALMALFHQRIPRHGDWLATGTLAVCFVAALFIFIRTFGADGNLVFTRVLDWLPGRALGAISAGIMVDKLTAIMLVVVTLVSFLVHLFSMKYMEGDIRYGRFFCSLLLFSASMLGLVLANNLLYLFVFWELVGLSSYLLIGHWYEKKSASDAAIKAFITTRIGDVGMFIGIMVIYLQVGSLQYADVFAAVESGVLSGDLRTIAAIGLFLGAMGKSAQFPLHVWLPDAMEGPTPVSALIHAATMVAAGVYLTGRMLPLFDPAALLFVAYIGAITALFAASIAFVQDDIKKVLAYSTVSQLGLMMLGLGCGGYVSGLFHLTTHAFFKAGLFLGSGSIIHAMHHEQSLSKYGGLWQKLPVTGICYLLCTLSLTGFPLLAGFWSKDAILADALLFAMQDSGHWFLPVAGFVTTFMTAFYMFRQFFLTFTGHPRDHHAYEHAHEGPWHMKVPLIILAFLAVTAGGFGGWFKSWNAPRTAQQQVAEFVQQGYFPQVAPAEADGVLAAHPEEHGDSEHAAHAAHTAHTVATVLATLFGLSGILLGAAFFYERKDGSTVLSPETVRVRVEPLWKVLSKKYYFDEMYDRIVVHPTHLLAKVSAVFDRLVIDSIVNLWGFVVRIVSVLVEILDRLVVDGLGVLGVARLTGRMGASVSLSQTGYVRQYLGFSAAGVIVISLIFLLI